MTATGKAITKAFYGRDAARSYYTGCSTGGQQGLIESLYYPDDYDGILVGAPVINRTWGHAAVLWDYSAAHRTPGSLLSDAKLKLLNRAAIATCWRQGHGLAGDAFISDPLSCRFDPAILQCKGTASDACLTQNEVTTARAFLFGPDKRGGQGQLFRLAAGESEMPDTFGWSLPANADKRTSRRSEGCSNGCSAPIGTGRISDFDRDMHAVDAPLVPLCMVAHGARTSWQGVCSSSVGVAPAARAVQRRCLSSEDIGA